MPKAGVPCAQSQGLKSNLRVNLGCWTSGSSEWALSGQAGVHLPPPTRLHAALPLPPCFLSALSPHPRGYLRTHIPAPRPY